MIEVLFLVLGFIEISFSQSAWNWTWSAGPIPVNSNSVYGTIGYNSEGNIPGGRSSSSFWIDSNNNLWLFGGVSYSYDGKIAYLNDLWKFDGTYWGWISGSDSINQIGNYGTKGIARLSNIPGGRYSAASWIDSNNNLWLFGGNGYNATGYYGWLNDLWRFNGTHWTWISGSNTTNQKGTYGTKGIASLSNIPSARSDSVSWIDSRNALWLFGGLGYATTGSAGYLNDLWRFDGRNWTWISGSNLINQRGIYARTSNIPGGRSDAVSWKDSDNTLWLFGGSGYDSAGSFGYLNDLWKFDGRNWAWISGSDLINEIGVYGTKGIADPTNVPGACSYSVSWIDSSDTLWLFGGLGYDELGNIGYLNGLWQYDGNDWTWISGSNTINQNGNYGTKGIASSSNIPGARSDAISWIDSSDTLWLFGGWGLDDLGSFVFLNDLLYFDGNNWTLDSGADSPIVMGIYGTKGIADSSNILGARWDATTWTDSNNNFWLFGGYGYAATTGGFLNDLWRFDGVNWAWISGSDTINQNGNYGIKGIASLSNIPDARESAVSWIDSNNNLWLFGGFGLDATGNQGYLNDLWKFDGTNWTWISGSNLINQNGTYGTKGIASLSNIPGGRTNAISWMDSTNNLWLFGGLRLNNDTDASSYEWLNDLWRFDGVNWTWISGSNTRNQNGNYGIKGIARLSNIPGARESAVSWKDSSDNFWLFGGFGFDASSAGFLNDLWRFNGTHWIWISGSNLRNQNGNYGTKGIASSSNIPGARSDAVSWIDSDNNLWLFGGYVELVSEAHLNDLWKFDGMNWIWISGSNLADQRGNYGTKGIASSSNIPGARYNAASWIDLYDNLWLFGGLGIDSDISNDLWKFSSNKTRSTKLTTNVLTTNILTTNKQTTSFLTSNSLTTDSISTSKLTTSPITTNEQTSSSITTNQLTTIPLTTNEQTTSLITTNQHDQTTTGIFQQLTSSPITTSQNSEDFLGTSSNTELPLIIGVSIGSFLVIIIIITILLAVLKIRSKKKRNPEMVEMSTNSTIAPPNPLKITQSRVKQEVPQIRNLKIREKLGGGNFGDVYLAMWNSTPVAAKKLKDSSKIEEFEKELEILSNVGSHPNIVQFLGFFRDDGEYLIFEFCRKGSLLVFLKETEKLNEEILIELVLGVCSGMAFLESKKIVHRDLSARNCLVSETDGKYIAKISDFGMSRTTLEKDYYSSVSGAIPVRWTAPEALAKGVYTSASDVWSFGITCLEIFTLGTVPFQWLSNQEVSEQVRKGNLKPTNKTEECPPELWAIIDLCFNVNPLTRPTFAELNEKISTFYENWRKIDKKSEESTYQTWGETKPSENYYN